LTSTAETPATSRSALSTWRTHPLHVIPVMRKVVIIVAP
jgi:hypothetical protein